MIWKDEKLEKQSKDGDTFYYIPGTNGQVIHRDEGPAVILDNGKQQEWWKYNKRHRVGGEPALIADDGHKEYWVNGERHREDGPAIEGPSSGKWEYWLHGKKVKPKNRHELATLWNGKQWVITDFSGTVLYPADKTNTLDNAIWVYSENYEPIYRPHIDEIRGNNPKPAATLHDINEGLPDPATGIKGEEYAKLQEQLRQELEEPQQEKTAQLKEDKHSLTFFRNYDYSDDPSGPGVGLYHGAMDKYKSVKDFIDKKKKRNKKRTNRAKMAVLLAITCPDAVAGRVYKKDTNDLQDPYEGPPNENAADKPSESSSFPYNPAEVNPIGVYDSIIPHEDWEFHPTHNMYWGIQESHNFSADDGKTSKSKDPYRNEQKDKHDALLHFFETIDNGEIDPAIKFDESRGIMPLKNILDWDDYSSWGDFTTDELKDLEPKELLETLAHFRGSDWANKAITWLSDSIPAIVLVEGKDSRGHTIRTIGDGRGRVNLAIGLGIKNLPVLILREKEDQ